MPLLKAMDYRSALFILALIVYGLLSSPTPDNPSYPEAIIFICLLGAIGLGNFLPLRVKQDKWQWAGLLLFTYCLIVPNIASIYHGYAVHNILRDLVGGVMLCLPLFLFPFIANHAKRPVILFYGVMGIGLAFSLRVLFLDFSFFTEKQALLYLANSPLVLLTALLLLLMGWASLQQRLSLRGLAITTCLFAIALLPIFAMIIDFQRASFIAIAMALLGYISIIFVQRPLRLIVPCGVVLIAGVFGYDFILDIIENITTKTAKVGLNMRSQEALAVWESVTISPMILIFGLGWGAEFESPAVGGLPVSFTHSLLSYMLLKTGLVGLSLTVVYLVFIFEKLGRLVFIKPVEFNALLWPFIIPILFYASYKSFDYGLILTLILVCNKVHTDKVTGIGKAKEL